MNQARTLALNNLSDENATVSFHPSFSPVIRFWTYLVFNILSILCTLFVLYHFLSDRILRRALHNHILIVLLIIGLFYELTNIPWILHHNRTGVPMIASPIFYIIWVCVDYAIYSLQIALFAWATIERHILIFHDSWVSTRQKRLWFHYGPMIGIILYYLIYYSILHFVPFCSNSFDDFLAGGIFIPCVFDRTFLGSWDLIVHQVVPTLIIVIFSAALILRVIWQKKRLNQPVTWRRHRKMTIQLISISSIYVLFNFPWTFLIFGFQYGLPEEVVVVPLVYAAYLYYYVIFLFPFACCGSLTELRQKVLQQIPFWKKDHAENPTKTLQSRTIDNGRIPMTKIGS